MAGLALVTRDAPRFLLICLFSLYFFGIDFAEGASEPNIDMARAKLLADKLKGKTTLDDDGWKWMGPKDGKLPQIGDACTVGPPPQGDSCVDQSVSMADFKKKLFVISDLARALVCNETSMKCTCAEDGSSAGSGTLEEDKLCLKSRHGVKIGEECIHHLECMNEHVCTFDATKNGNSGNIQDMRRFCGGATTTMLSSMLVFVAIMIGYLV